MARLALEPDGAPVWWLRWADLRRGVPGVPSEVHDGLLLGAVLLGAVRPCDPEARPGEAERPAPAAASPCHSATSGRLFDMREAVSLPPADCEVLRRSVPGGGLASGCTIVLLVNASSERGTVMKLPKDTSTEIPRAIHAG